MTGCCDESAVRFDGATPAYRRALFAVIAINAAMFAVEMAAGFLGDSMALRADALDFLGDTATYAMSLAVIGLAPVWRGRAALVKGVSLGLVGLWVLGATAYRVIALGAPEPLVMGGVGLLAAAANLASVAILFRFRDGEANVRSVWLCSRNDAIGNAAVVVAGAAVYVSGTAWPDLAVAAAMAGLFLASAAGIVRQALGELRAGWPAESPAAE